MWLLSPRCDFWLASAGASGALLAAIAVILLHGDREIDALDLVLSELHLGATYHAVIQRRLWRRLPIDVLLVPLMIMIVSYGLALSSQSTLLTSIAMYAAVWHRGRQSFGVARFYQRAATGPVSRVHEWLFCAAIYLPMAASALAYAHLSPTHYEGEPYFAPSTSAEFVIAAGFSAALCLGAYLFYALCRNFGAEASCAQRQQRIHPAECWVVLAHAVAFGSSYLFGASNAAFLFVLAVHHEVQYLHFTYAMSRRKCFQETSPGSRFETFPNLEVAASAGRASRDVSRIGSFTAEALSARSSEPTADLKPAASFGWSTHPARQSEWWHAAAFSVWPVVGLAGALAGGWLALPWLAPLGIGGLFCHYWLDGRIWTSRAMG